MKTASRQGSSHFRAGITPAAPSPGHSLLPLKAHSSINGLREEYRQLFHTGAPKLSRDLLVRAIGYRRQEIEHGGIGNATRRKLQTIAKALRSTGRVGPTPSLSLKPGARLVREWHGRTHTVTMADDGFEYAGASYTSLSTIAKKITGAHWSGPRFFGLLAADAAQSSRQQGDE